MIILLIETKETQELLFLFKISHVMHEHVGGYVKINRSKKEEWKFKLMPVLIWYTKYCNIRYFCAVFFHSVLHVSLIIGFRLVLRQYSIHYVPIWFFTLNITIFVGISACPRDTSDFTDNLLNMSKHLS